MSFLCPSHEQKLVLWPHFTPWRQGKHGQTCAQTEGNPKYKVSPESGNIGEYTVNIVDIIIHEGIISCFQTFGYSAFGQQH